MPYFLDENLEDEQNKDPSQVQISGASPTTDKEGSPNGSPGAAPPTGSGFQNLDKYLNTNQSKQFGQQVLGNVSNEVQSAKQNQDAASQKFKDQVQSSNQLPTGDQVNQAIANPTGADKSQFQGWLTQGYKGPNSLAENQGDWNQYWSGTNKANTSAQLLGTEAGRFSLLDSYFGKPNYNFGEKGLDNLLVQQSGLGRDTRNLQNQATQLNSQGQVQAKQLQDVAAQRAGEVEKSKDAARAAIGIDANNQVITGDGAGAIGQQYKQVDDQVAQQNAQRLADQQELAQNLPSDFLTQNELGTLGLQGNDNLYNLDLKNYITPNADLTRNQVLTPEQKAHISALNQLAGVDNNSYTGDLTAASNPYSFDLSRFQQDEAGQKAGYQSASAASIGQVNQAAEAARQDMIKQNGGGGLSEGQQAQINQMYVDAANKVAQQYQANRLVRALPRAGGGPQVIPS